MTARTCLWTLYDSGLKQEVGKGTGKLSVGAYWLERENSFSTFRIIGKFFDASCSL